jgi:adenosylmethionine-8-amino-7-oxononanoate transaminase
MGARGDRLSRLDKLHVWHPFTQMKEWEEAPSLVIERAEGSYLVDVDDRRYLDGVSSMWVNVHGHGKAEIDRAIRDQLKKVAHSTLLGLSNVPSIELARELVRRAPKGLTKVFYSDNGSTAVEAAMKMAYQYWAQTPPANRKRRFIAFSGAYHGDTFGAMSVGEIDVFVKRYRPLLFKAFRAPYPYCYRCPLKKTHPACGLECLSLFEAMLKRHSSTIAACVIEPLMQGASGMIPSPPGFLKGVRRLTRRYDVLLIADEVATGFGRTGRMFACEAEGVAPDFLCLAKGLTGGYLPIAATLTTKEVYDAFLGPYEEFRAFFHGHTYTGNPLGCAAALASLRVFSQERVIKRLGPKIAAFKALLEPMRGLRHAGDVRQTGLVAGIELVRDRATKEPYGTEERVGHRVCMEARKRGLIIRPLGDTIVVMPPLSATPGELKAIAGIVLECIRVVTEGADRGPDEKGVLHNRH